MSEKQKLKENWLQSAIVRASRVHFAYISAYIASIIAFDTWNLITHEGIVWRWKAASIMLALTTIAWFMARTRVKSSHYYRSLIMVLVTADIVFASYNVYWQRGMASKSVALYAVPIIIAAILRSRRVVLATAILSLAAYSYTAVRYFHLHYGEGFKVELYGEVGFYAAVFFVLAWLLLIIIKPNELNS